jgi:hypothetical protein
MVLSASETVILLVAQICNSGSARYAEEVVLVVRPLLAL